MGPRRTWLELSATERQTRRQLFCSTAAARDRTGLKPTGETSVADPTNREGARAERRQPDTRLTPPRQDSVRPFSAAAAALDPVAFTRGAPITPRPAWLSSTDHLGRSSPAFSPASRSQLAPPGAISTHALPILVRSFEIGVLRRSLPKPSARTWMHPPHDPQSPRKPGLSFRDLGAEFAAQSLTVSVQLPRRTVHATPVPKGSRVTTNSIQRRLARPTSCPQAALALRGPLVGPRSRRLWTTLQPSHTESAPPLNPHTGCTFGAQNPRKAVLSCSFPAGCAVYVL